MKKMFKDSYWQFEKDSDRCSILIFLNF